MRNQLAIIAAAVSISCGVACSSTITAEPWHPKESRTGAQQRAKDAALDDDDRDADDGHADHDAGE